MIAKRMRQPGTRNRVEETDVDGVAATAQADTNGEPSNGRDGKGRFAPGNSGGPGNPFARQTAQLRSALVQRVTKEDMERIADDLVFMATNGNLAAIKLLFQYVIGKPAAAVNPDTLDVQEFREVYAPRKEIMELGPQLVHGLPPNVHNILIGIMNDFCAKQLHKVLSLPPEQLATADLAAFFPGAQAATAPPAPVNGDESDPIVADINRMLHSDDEDDEEDQETEDELNETGSSPSTNRCNGVSRPTEAGRRPSPNGKIGREGKHPRQPAAAGAKEETATTSPQRRPLNDMQRARPQKQAGRPSTNADPRTDRRGGDDRNRDGRRRCA
jgi:hypothetical protein